MVNSKVPLLEQQKMLLFSELIKECLAIQLETYRMLVSLSVFYEDVIIGDAKEDQLDVLIENEQNNMKTLSATMAKLENEKIEEQTLTF